MFEMVYFKKKYFVMNALDILDKTFYYPSQFWS